LKKRTITYGAIAGAALLCYLAVSELRRSEFKPGGGLDHSVQSGQNISEPAAANLTNPGGLSFASAVQALEGGSTLRDLSYAQLKRIEERCSDAFKVAEVGGTVDDLYPSTEAHRKLLEQVERRCMAVPAWLDLGEIIADKKSQLPESDEFLTAKRLPGLEKTVGLSSALDVAKGLQKTDSADVFMEAWDYIDSHEGALREILDLTIIDDLGVSSDEAELIAHSSIVNRYCRLGGDCSPTSVKARVFCSINESACGLDVMSIIEHFELSPGQWEVMLRISELHFKDN